MKWAPVDPKPGDIIRIPLGVFYHYGVYVSDDEVIAFGLPPIPENRGKQSEIAVLATDIDVFASGRIVETAVLDFKERRRRIPPQKTIEAARARLGEVGYNIIHNNCEHFANECVFGEKRSEQADSVRHLWSQFKQS